MRTRELADLWGWFARAHFHRYSPLYERIAYAVAADRSILEMVRAAPEAAQPPPVLLAAVHYLVRGGLEHPLADVYAGRSDADPGPLFRELCRRHRDEVAMLLATRTLQTNECGRSALIGPALSWIASQHEAPLALVDVGASAGLNLLGDRYCLDYGPHGTTGPRDSPVRIRCRVVGGAPPIAARLPSLMARVGIDRSPVDLADPDQLRWLLACVWPDTGRLERTAAAIRLAQQDPPTVVAGDANHVLPGVLAGLPDGAVAVVVTTWTFAYLTVDERLDFVRLLAAASRHRPVAWLSGEGMGMVEALATATSDSDAPDVLGVISFEDSARRTQRLGFIHPHGHWIDWRL